MSRNKSFSNVSFACYVLILMLLLEGLTPVLNTIGSPSLFLPRFCSHFYCISYFTRLSPSWSLLKLINLLSFSFRSISSSNPATSFLFPPSFTDYPYLSSLIRGLFSQPSCWVVNRLSPSCSEPWPASSLMSLISITDSGGSL